MPRKDKDTPRRLCGPGTAVPGSEALLHLLLAGLFGEREVPLGLVIDVGANNGEMACFYASLDSHRTVHAIEPTQKLYSDMLQRYKSVSNMAIHRAGLSSSDALSSAVARSVMGGQGLSLGAREKRTDQPFPVYRVDTLFGSGGLFAGEKLGFWHLDVEGFELNALRGASSTLARDAPLLAVEVHVHGNRTFTVELLSHLFGIGYSLYVVDEVCGRLDCRNLLGAPAALFAGWQRRSTSFQLATVTAAIYQISSVEELFERTPSTVSGLKESCTLRHHTTKVRNDISPRWIEGRLG